MPSGSALAKRPRHLARQTGTRRLAPFIAPITLAEGADSHQSWAQVLRTGDFYDPRYGDFTITRRDLATMLSNFKSGKYPQGATKIPADYNHGTSHANSVDEGKAAGWIADLELRADGDELWAHVEWTETAAALIDSKEYQFTSATFSFEYTNSNGGDDLGPTLLAFAITNRPVVHGMQPLALSLVAAGAVRLGDAPRARATRGRRPLEAAADDEMVEALFTFDETRRRVQAALTATYGSPYSYDSSYDAPYRGVYLIDLKDGLAFFCNYDGAKFRIGYDIASDGTVTFTSEPAEVVIDYRPLTATLAEETSMSTIKVKDAKGTEIELAQDAIDAIVKAHAPKPAAAAEIDLANHPQFKTLQATVTEQATTIQTLSAKNLALETEGKEKDAKTRVETLVRDGRIAPAERDEMVTLAIEEPKAFDVLEKQLAKRARVADYKAGPVGSGADGSSTSASQEVVALAKAAIGEDKTLSMASATERVFQQNPELYRRYVAETAVKV
jgi:hypothetical protein